MTWNYVKPTNYQEKGLFLAEEAAPQTGLYKVGAHYTSSEKLFSWHLVCFLRMSCDYLQSFRLVDYYLS